MHFDPFVLLLEYGGVGAGHPLPGRKRENGRNPIFVRLVKLFPEANCSCRRNWHPSATTKPEPASAPARNRGTASRALILLAISSADGVQPAIASLSIESNANSLTHYYQQPWELPQRAQSREAALDHRDAMTAEIPMLLSRVQPNSLTCSQIARMA